MHATATARSFTAPDRLARLLRGRLALLGCLAVGLALCGSPASARTHRATEAVDQGPRPLQLSDLPPELRAMASRNDAAAPELSGEGRVVDRGVASWYGGRHNGRRTASGSRFDQREMTAAHAFLPLGTRVRVVREDTGEAVVVTITDRIGTHRRVIDLSRGAAVALNMIGPGVAPVRIEIL